ncbi:MAG: 3-phosphoserine/phosphohydroxythreonine transaminase, partial [Flavobacteriales bacterium]|nr:3-phosphoserine/phosphohydroxythreonine transaminase [Flavobacteriales bacterium]
ESVVELDGSGLSLIEISHRSKAFVDIMEEARSLVKELLGLPSGYEVLFLQGGASLGFLTAAYNFNAKGKTAGYVNTGTWSKKAIKEAKTLTDVHVIASSEDQTYNHIPAYPGSDTSTVHITSNNTIFGTQFQEFPEVSSDQMLIADMSSDIFSKKLDVSKFDMIYAGAQKNMGPAGTVMYIINTEKLGHTGHNIPSYLDLQVHLDKDSMFNTPPVFAVYTSMLTLRWLKELGGVSEIEKINKGKADLLYSEIDRNSLFTGHAETASRSKMNATFRLTNDDVAADFDAMWNDAGINGLKGHRSVGGYRASMYNALPLESVQVLVDVMKELENKKG